MASTHYAHALTQLLAWHDPFPELTKALEIDPNHCLSRCCNEVLLAMNAMPRTWTGTWPTGSNERETLHVKAAETWCCGREGDAEKLYAEIATRWPEDALGLKLHQDACFFLGRSSSMQAAERAAEHWRKHQSTSHEHFPYVLGMASFAAEENARYADALEYGKEAVRLCPTEQWAIHGVGTSCRNHLIKLLD